MKNSIIKKLQSLPKEMKDSKGKDYAMSYMKTHWPKINLSKVL